MAKNNTLWKAVAMIITLSTLAGGIIYGYAILSSEVAGNTKLHPRVEKNTEFRLQSEIDTKYLKEKISNIEIVQRQILEEVRKR